MYLIGREAIVNSLAHSQGSVVEVEINYGHAGVRLRVRDDGKGISPEILRSGGVSGHWGLSGMVERAHKIGGQCKIWNRTGAGTEVELNVPGGVAYPRQIGSSFGSKDAICFPLERSPADRGRNSRAFPLRSSASSTVPSKVLVAKPSDGAFGAGQQGLSFDAHKLVAPKPTVFLKAELGDSGMQQKSTTGHSS